MHTPGITIELALRTRILRPKNPRGISSPFVMAATLLLSSLLYAADPLKMETDPQQAVEVPYRLFKTDNIWTQVLLDTRDGRLWQIQYTVDTNGYRGKIPINSQPLVTAARAKPGRFTLYNTRHMWTFLLLDQEDGRVWQCQFSVQDDSKATGLTYRFIVPVLSLDEQLLLDSLSSLFLGERTELADSSTPDQRRQHLLDKIRKANEQEITETQATELVELARQQMRKAKEHEIAETATTEFDKSAWAHLKEGLTTSEVVALLGPARLVDNEDSGLDKKITRAHYFYKGGLKKTVIYTNGRLTDWSGRLTE